MPKYPIPDYLGALKVVSIDEIGKFSPEEWFASNKEDGQFVRIEIKDGKMVDLRSRWGEEITGAYDDGFRELDYDGISGVFVGELEAGTEYSTKIVRERGYRKISLLDVLEFNGEDLRETDHLERLLRVSVIWCDHFKNETAKKFRVVHTEFHDFRKLYADSHEGIILKKRVGKYESHRSNKKTEDFVKLKKSTSQSMVLMGFTTTKISGSITGLWGLWDGNKVVQTLIGGFPGIELDNRDEWIGKVADLKGFEVSQRGSLRSGSFEKWRPEYSKEDCPFGQERVRR